MGHYRERITLPSEDTNQQLPDKYTTVPAVALNQSKVKVPEHPDRTRRIVGDTVTAMKQEHNWLDTAVDILQKERLEKGDSIAWAAYHATHQDTSCLTDIHPVLTHLLPLFYEKAATVAILKHGMDIIQLTTEFLNPGQIPVLAMDAPLYALAKHIQWKWPEAHGEETYVIMFGGLHIEMAMWKTFGDYMQDSGWTNALTQAGVDSSGTATSFLRCCHLT